MDRNGQELKTLSREEMEQAAGGTFNENRYTVLEYADAGIRVVTHFIARDEFWWNGSDIGYDNANAVVSFCRNNGGRQPASLEEALRSGCGQTAGPKNHGCDLVRLA